MYIFLLIAILNLVKYLFLLIALVSLAIPSFASARIGVGVGTGKIEVEDELKPGTIYELPPLTVINTGDEASHYEVAVSYHEKQSELRPERSWFIFSPQQFELDPGEVQTVTVKVDLPVRVEPGKYFAYLEGHPLKKSESGEASIGIAAAAKLYFTVVPGSFIEGIYYKVLSFWNIYAPWSQRAATLLGIIVVALIFKRFFHIEIGRKKATHKKHSESTNSDTSENE